jgi:CO/xanthine dehydrogenase FAD-binding subunit
MKAAPFEYSRPADVAEACALLAADENARVIAGGQTLVPMMAMRLARPTRLVDIAQIAELSFIRDDGDSVTIGAATRQCIVEHSALVRDRLPLVARAIPWIGHTATRARGTVGGSIAHADQAAELPLLALTLDATLSYRASDDVGDIPATEFFIGPTITTLSAGALLTEVRFPIWQGRVGTAFHEVNARRSDFAFAAAAAQVELAGNGTCARIALGIGGVSDIPIRLDEAEEALIDTPLEPDAVRDIVRGALSGIECTDDLHASAHYRRRAALTLALRALADAKADAQGRQHAG